MLEQEAPVEAPSAERPPLEPLSSEDLAGEGGVPAGAKARAEQGEAGGQEE